MMRARHLTLVLVLGLLAVAPLTAGQTPATPQAPAAPSPSPRPNKVFLSGENPVIFLYDRPGGETETFVSFWRIHWSPVGHGHVCYVTSGKQGSPGALRIALHDNPRLLDYLTSQVLGTYNKTYLDQPFTRSRVPPSAARATSYASIARRAGPSATPWSSRGAT